MEGSGITAEEMLQAKLEEKKEEEKEWTWEKNEEKKGENVSLSWVEEGE